MTHDTGSFKKVALLTGLMMLFGGAEISSAATIVQSKSFGPLTGFISSTTLTYDLFDFDPSDAQLLSVAVVLTAQVAEPQGVGWSLVVNVNNGALGVTVSDDVPANVTVGASLAAAAFIGVGDFPVLFTYNAQCGFVGVPTCSTGSSGNLDITYNFFAAPAEVPLPAALPLFATGLGALGLLTWRRKRKAIAAKFEVLG